MNFNQMIYQNKLKRKIGQAEGKRINEISIFSKLMLVIKPVLLLIFVGILFSFKPELENVTEWIRINQLGYTPRGIKVAVWVSKNNELPATFQLIDKENSEVVFTASTGKSFGKYGPFSQSFRLNFSSYKNPGNYYIKCGSAVSPEFKIDENVYAGTADFSLRYMRQQRSGFNPFLKDSCHTHDGYTMYGPMPDSTHINVLDEATWGLDWLLKMYPRRDWMFNQLADDRDHQGFRLPTEDPVDYGLGKGNARPVYFATGKPQGLGKYKNNSTGVASTAGKFASAFALAANLYEKKDPLLTKLLKEKSISAYQLGLDKPGVCQTAPNLAPYYYAEDNWVDDMELGAAALFQLTGDKKYFKQSLKYSAAEKVTPWIGADTAKHYQWYPFHNFGHYELAKNADVKTKAELISYYKEGIERVWKKADKNAFYRGIPVSYTHLRAH